MLAGAFVLEPAARTKAEALLAALPPEVRVKYPTPEKLVGLFFAASTLAGADRAQVLLAQFLEPDEAIQQVKVASGPLLGLRMRRGVPGWQLVIAEQAIDHIARELRGKTANP